mgnify:CR=1 FL=1
MLDKQNIALAKLEMGWNKLKKEKGLAWFNIPFRQNEVIYTYSNGEKQTLRDVINGINYAR